MTNPPVETLGTKSPRAPQAGSLHCIAVFSLLGYMWSLIEGTEHEVYTWNPLVLHMFFFFPYDLAGLRFLTTL